MTEEHEPHIHTPEQDKRPKDEGTIAPFDEIGTLRAMLSDARKEVRRLKERNFELERLLDAKSGMGIQENVPDTFNTLRR